eukprot:scaffold2696_cov104-Cylindrotheca_fusiformis.AAC.8
MKGRYGFFKAYSNTFIKLLHATKRRDPRYHRREYYQKQPEECSVPAIVLATLLHLRRDQLQDIKETAKRRDAFFFPRDIVLHKNAKR